MAHACDQAPPSRASAAAAATVAVAASDGAAMNQPAMAAWATVFAVPALVLVVAAAAVQQ